VLAPQNLLAGPSQKKAGKKPQENIAKYDTNQFDLGAEQLPKDYLGHDLEKLYSELEQKFPKKTEFETKETYKKRLHSSSYQGIYAFTVQSPITSKYDPERKQLQIDIQASGKYNPDQEQEIYRKQIYDRDGEACITVKSLNVGSKTYTGTNRFGATVDVKQYQLLSYGIALVNKQRLERDQYSGRGRRIAFNLMLEPEEAKGLKENLGVLVICRLKPSGVPEMYTFRSAGGIEPTIKTPLEVIESERLIYADLIEVWIYNRKSGAILSKRKIESGGEQGSQKMSI
jgi:hypothetical protein